jgi:hypothetical protein
MEKLKLESSSEETSKIENVLLETLVVISASEKVYSKKIKPRALVFKATDKDLGKIKELIETQFTNVEIIYVTSAPAASILRVTKLRSFETQNSSEQPLFSIE